MLERKRFMRVILDENVIADIAIETPDETMLTSAQIGVLQEYLSLAYKSFLRQETQRLERRTEADRIIRLAVETHKASAHGD